MTYEYKKFSFDEPWLSKSSIFLYNFCPYAFWLKYVKNVETDVTEQMKRGSRFHDWAENIYEKIDKEKLVKGDTSIEKEYSKYKNENDSVYDNFIELEKDRWKSFDDKYDFFPVLTEEFLTDEDLYYFGTFDRLDKFDDDKYIVIDYKTGSYKKYKDSEYRFQLYGYKHLIEENYDDYDITHMGVYFPDEEKIIVEEFKKITGTYFYKKVKNTREKILNKEFPMDGYCKYCYMEDECMSFKEGR